MSANGFHGAFRQSMAWLHTWAGLVLSVLLYFIFVTGTFGYFNAEIDHWMQPEAPSPKHSVSTAAMAQMGFDYLQREQPDARRHFVGLPTERGNAIRVFANLSEPTPAGDTFIEAYIDPSSGQLVDVRATGGGDALYRMHYALHYMPYEVAIYIVGVATLFMLLAILTGIVVHKKIFTDFFTLRLRKGQRSWLDGHNISSVLALPFMLMITYSGLVFYTFEYSPGTMFLTMGVEQEARDEMYGYLYPGFEQPKPTGEPAVMVDVQGPLSVAASQWPNAEIRFVDIFLPGDSGAMMRIGSTVDGIARGGSLLQFNAVSGQVMAQTPDMPADAVFSQSVLALHEGRFANYGLRWLYFISGLLGAAMVATGLLLWAKKRRSSLRGQAVPRHLAFIERTNLGIIVGLPLGVMTYFWANRILPVAMEGRAEWELHCLFLAWALSFAHAGARELRRAWREQVALLAAMCLLLPILNAITTDVHLGNTLVQGDWVRAGFDLTSMTFGLLCCLTWRYLTVPQPRTIKAPLTSQAATAPKASA